jgi:hypothetical protein
VKRFRVSIAGLMAVVALVAVDSAAVRTLIAADYQVPMSATSSMDLLGFALGVLPMASLLILVAMARLPRCIRRGEPATFLVGFEVFGWAVIFLFICLSALSPPAVGRLLDAAALPIGRVLLPYIAHAPEWVPMAIEVVLVVSILGLPELLVALFGGWLTRRLGLTVSIERRRALPTPAAPDPLGALAPVDAHA